MNRLVYLLILVLISAQVDDTWAVATYLPSTSPAEDYDEFLPARRQVRDEQLSTGQGPLFAGLTFQTADFSIVRRGIPSEWNLITPFTPPPLYVFMSLQI